jgi:hypothetical protein
MKYARGSAAPGEIASGSSHASAACFVVATTSAVFTRGSFSRLAVLLASATSCANGDVARVFPGLVEADAIAPTTLVHVDVNAITITTEQTKDGTPSMPYPRVGLPLLRAWIERVTPRSWLC